MNAKDCQDLLDDLTNDELMAKLEEAKIDLRQASMHEPESEWHEACFAGMLFLAREVQKRGLKSVPVH